MATTTEALAGLLSDSGSTVIFTGAGMSTESGIPDFRSPGGIWSKYQPVYFDEFMASSEARREYWRQKTEAHVEFAKAEPNVGHRILGRWEQESRIQGVVTQNIDGLHQLAGSHRVLELHGTAREAACMECGDRQPIQPLVDAFLADGEPPDCEHCSGPLKHATISFGQALDEAVMTEAVRWMEQAELVIVLGSSLVVHPAASLPELAVQSGARLVIVNRDPTPLDTIADMVIHESIGSTLESVDARCRTDV